MDREVRAVDYGRAVDSDVADPAVCSRPRRDSDPVRRRRLRFGVRSANALRHRRIGPDDRPAAWTLRAQDGGMAAPLLLAAREHRLQHSERTRRFWIAV